MFHLSDKKLPLSNDDVLAINIHSNGFYRIQYGQIEAEKLQNLLMADHKRLPMAARARIISDAFTLASAGYIDYKFALNFTKYLKNEREFVPWAMALAGFPIMQKFFEGKPEEEKKFRKYLKSILQPLFDEEIGGIDRAESEETKETNFFKE